MVVGRRKKSCMPECLGILGVFLPGDCVVRYFTASLE